MEQAPNFTFGSTGNNAAMGLKCLTFLPVWMLILHTGQGLNAESSACGSRHSQRSQE